MDLETGEYGSRDDETGELIPFECDSETGEFENSFSRSSHRTPFRIYENKGKYSTSPPPRSTQNMSQLLIFLLPTLFVYSGISVIAIAVLEVSIHIWAHKKNKNLANEGVYYKSPLHVLCSEFCAKCRDEKYMMKIGKLQDERTHRLKCHYEYVKRIVT